jgi:hypothetical protein
MFTFQPVKPERAMTRRFGCYTGAVVSLADSPRYESGSVPGAGAEGEVASRPEA